MCSRIRNLNLNDLLQVLLQSDKIDANFSDRSLLKNLGHFLGMITLARNTPILFEVSIIYLYNIEYGLFVFVMFCIRSFQCCLIVWYII